MICTCSNRSGGIGIVGISIKLQSFNWLSEQRFVTLLLALIGDERLSEMQTQTVELVRGY